MNIVQREKIVVIVQIRGKVLSKKISRGIHCSSFNSNMYVMGINGLALYFPFLSRGYYWPNIVMTRSSDDSATHNK